MKKKIEELNVLARLSELVFGDGFLHYGLWPSGLPDKPSLSALGKAQTDFVDRLESAFPPNTKTILDVGSGTGAIAMYLSRLGYSMTCICPSATMNDLARAKLPNGTAVYTTKFEAFEHEEMFDICIFAESFHYIDLQTALSKSAHLAKRGVVIFDYFRRAPKEAKATEQGTRGTHADFLAALEQQNAFRVVQDNDLTASIAPTFLLLDHLQANHVAPLLSDIRAQMKARAPIRAWLAEKFLGRQLDKLGRKKNRASKFADTFEYRLITLEKIVADRTTP
ncbi:MAG: class I SAM-dependent methyltransferase [Methylotenera sp.]